MSVWVHMKPEEGTEGPWTSPAVSELKVLVRCFVESESKLQAGPEL